MSEITEPMLKAIMPNTPKLKRQQILPILNKVCLDYGITNELRIAAFLATLAVESAEFKYTSELASGDAYDTRTDLGNTPQRDGDGRLYKGHGNIQITGKTNHGLYTDYLRQNEHLPFIDFVAHPARLAEQPYALDSAGWFFAKHINANPLADKRQFLAIQIRVNGRNKKTGLPNNWNERKGYYERALRVIPDDFALNNAATELVPDDSFADYDNHPNSSAEVDNSPQTVTTLSEPEKPSQAAITEQSAPVPDAPVTQNADQIINTGNDSPDQAKIEAAKNQPDTIIEEKTKTGYISKLMALFGLSSLGDVNWSNLTANDFVIQILHSIWDMRYLIIGALVIWYVARKIESLYLKHKQIEANTDPTKGNVILVPAKADTFIDRSLEKLSSLFAK